MQYYSSKFRNYSMFWSMFILRQEKAVAGHLDATELTPDSLTRRTRHYVRLDVGDILKPKMSH